VTLLDLLVYKALHDATAAYLVDDCQLVSHAGVTPAHAGVTPAVAGSDPPTSTRAAFHGPAHDSDRSFAAAGPRLWNSLPGMIRQPDNDIGEFRRQLKSFLFN